MKKIIYIFAFVSICTSVRAQKVEDAMQFISKESLRKNIQILASDSFGGRKPFSVGEERTIHFLENKFKEIGLKPGNGTSYLQGAPMIETLFKPDSVMKVQSAQSNFTLKKMDDYVLFTDKATPAISLKNERLIFAGYGVVAPEYGWDDYKNINVKGKIVVVLVNDPGFGTDDTTLFKGKTMTYYGRWSYKFEEAARHGAKGCLIIHNTAGASYPFSVVQTSNSSSKLFLNEGKNGGSSLLIQGWLSGPAGLKILKAAGKDSSLIVSANRRSFKAIPLEVKISLNAKVVSKYNTSYNVVGKITGSKYPNEYIIYTAHWDHLGIGIPNEKGDSIYNGALDNASGVAALLEIAKAFAHLKPERTILFLSVTGEEQGLLGSQYYATHPIYPLSKTVANVNMDVMNVYGETKNFSLLARGQNELEDYVIKAGQMQGRYFTPSGDDVSGSYFRSDHFSFAKVGVPAVACGNGGEYSNQNEEELKKMREYGPLRYHKPTDEFDAFWPLDGAIQDSKFLYLIGALLATERSWPQWKEGSLYKKIRDQSK
jgi:Zn-dependent M28 family amino/carboxypeptidase